MNELFPCPFCGGFATVYADDKLTDAFNAEMAGNEKSVWWVECANRTCKLLVYTKEPMTRAEAVAAWNEWKLKP